MEIANVMSETLKRWEIISSQPLTKVYRSKLCRFIVREAKHFALKGQYNSYNGGNRFGGERELYLLHLIIDVTKFQQFTVASNSED